MDPKMEMRIEAKEIILKEYKMYMLILRKLNKMVVPHVMCYSP